MTGGKKNLFPRADSIVTAACRERRKEKDEKR